jgi:hypothetical protein
MEVLFVSENFTDDIFTFSSFKSAVRHDKHYRCDDNLNPTKLWDRRFQVSFSGVNGCVYVTIYKGESDYILHGNCKDCHARTAIQYLSGKRFQRRLFKSISACKGTVD